MKILFDLTDLYDHLSGIERYALELSVHMIRQHPEEEYVLLFKEEIPPAYYDIVMQENVRSIVLPGKNKLMFRQITLPRKLFTISADAYVFLAFPEPWLFQRNNIITAVHDMTCFDCGEHMKWSSKWFFRISDLHTFRYAQSVLTVSKFSAKRILGWGGRLTGCSQQELKKKLFLIRDGISPIMQKKEYGIEWENHKKELQEKYNLPEHYILSLSTLEPRKNLKLLVRAYEALAKKHPDIPQLVLAGRNGWKMETFLTDHSLEKKLNFPGFIDDEDLPDLYSGAELFVFPSSYEGFGLPPLEAMAAGCPVLSSDAASMPEVLGKEAIYFQNKDLKDLTDRLERALSMPEEEKERLRERGRERAKMFQWTDSADRLHKVIANSR